MTELLVVVGAVVAGLGLVVVAPYELGALPPRMGAWLLHRGRQARNWLARWIPFLKRGATVNVGGVAAATVRITGSAIARVGLSAEGEVADQLRVLRHALASVYGELDGLRDEQSKLRAELTARLDTLTAEASQLRQAMQEQQVQQRRLNGQGLPLAAVGLLLSAVPGTWLEGGGWWLAGPLLAVGLVAVAVGIGWLRRAWPEVREGWSDTATKPAA